MKLFHFAFRNMWRNKRRSVLSTATVAFGTLAVLVAAGFMEYSFYGLQETTIRTDLGHIQIENPAPAQLKGGEHPLVHGLENVTALKKHVNEMASVRYSMARLELQGIISNGEQSEIFVGRGIEANKEEAFASSFAPLVAGRGLSIATIEEPQESHIVLGEGLAAKLNVKPGDWVTILTTTVYGGLNGMDFKVAGLIRHFIPEYNERFVMLALPVAQELLQTDKVSRLIVVLRDTLKTDTTLAQIRAQFPKLTVIPWYEKATFYNSVVSLYWTIFGFLGSIIFIVVILTSFNTLMMTVMERIPEVGTLMAVGIPRVKVMWAFLLEGGLIGFFGALIGMIATLGVAVVVNLIQIPMPPPPGGTFGYPFKLHLVGEYFIMIPLLITVACMLATYVPARYASRLNISWALRHR
ncbi:MAG: ABC transporter permease [Candidatus Parabeggiatoa sp. nov. 1]|nr:MAG: ABC transporter permease [Gammaproteobacteria bacterium]